MVRPERLAEVTGSSNGADRPRVDLRPLILYTTGQEVTTRESCCRGSASTVREVPTTSGGWHVLRRGFRKGRTGGGDLRRQRCSPPPCSSSPQQFHDDATANTTTQRHCAAIPTQSTDAAIAATVPSADQVEGQPDDRPRRDLRRRTSSSLPTGRPSSAWTPTSPTRSPRFSGSRPPW